MESTILNVRGTPTTENCWENEKQMMCVYFSIVPWSVSCSPGPRTTVLQNWEQILLVKIITTRAIPISQSTKQNSMQFSLSACLPKEFGLVSTFTGGTTRLWHVMDFQRGSSHFCLFPNNMSGSSYLVIKCGSQAQQISAQQLTVHSAYVKDTLWKMFPALSSTSHKLKQGKSWSE